MDDSGDLREQSVRWLRLTHPNEARYARYRVARSTVWSSQDLLEILYTTGWKAKSQGELTYSS